MKENEIKNYYKQKIDELSKNNKLYFDKSAPKITDADYDQLKKEIINLEKKYKYLKSSLSPSNSLGYLPSKNFVKFKHRVKMLSLSNAFDFDDLENFEKKIFNYLNKKTEIEYSVEPKIDGISASLTYKNGLLVMGTSRGDGISGEVITENLKTISDIPQRITNKDFPKDIDIRGEVFIKKSNFKKIKNDFANPRNAASGSLRQKNPADTKKVPLNFIAYTYGYFDDNKIKKQSDFLNSLKKWGFQINEHNKILKNVSDLVNFHKKFENNRFDLE